VVRHRKRIGLALVRKESEMRNVAAAVSSLFFPLLACAQAPALTREEVRMVAPALDRYTQGTLMGDLWQRPDLSRRDRSVVTLAALIARNQTIEMPYQINLALDNGVKPREISEIITHLAFYSGWPNALSAVAAAKDVFRRRGVRSDPTTAGVRRITSPRPGDGGPARGASPAGFWDGGSGRCAVHQRCDHP
jgi:alkylhydroperoxidase/carboxymuconolactone decarboxylase family protein YurZ